MKQSVMLTILSVLSVLLMTLHLADDIVRGFEKGGPSNRLAVPILVTWLYGTLMLAERRSGRLVGVSAVFSVILSAHGLWRLQWGRSDL